MGSLQHTHTLRLPRQKLAQLDNSNLMELLDVSLLWVWLLPRLSNLLGNVDKVSQMWSSGTEPVTFLALHSPPAAKAPTLSLVLRPGTHDNRLRPAKCPIVMGFSRIP